jgi:hypothetical protein
VGIEPTSSAWKAEVIAIIRCPHPGTRLPESFCTEYERRPLNIRADKLLVYSLGLRNALPNMVVGEGFEPSKSMTADLQSAPFGRSGTPPGVLDGAGYRNRTGDLLITSQLLYLLS